MSWMVTYDTQQHMVDNVIKDGGIPDALSLDQFDAAKNAVLAVIASGTVGSPDKLYYIQIGGHSNPNHEPSPGMSNDALWLNVYQRS